MVETVFEYPHTVSDPRPGRVESKSFVFFEHHKPVPEDFAYHFHTSVEINFLRDCDMTYSFSGDTVTIKSGHFSVFWAAYPHRVLDVQGEGHITNAYIGLAEFLRWPLPAKFVNTILGGSMLCTRQELDGDDALARRWASEIGRDGPDWAGLHAIEIRARLSRLALEGWDVVYDRPSDSTNRMVGGNAVLHFEKMLRFVATNFCDRLSIRDVADHAGVSQNYAISIFRRLLGRTIKEHITDMRIVHAKMLLAETDRKILTIAMDCGFSSLSPFYEAFTKSTGTSPAAFRNGEGRSKLIVST